MKSLNNTPMLKKSLIGMPQYAPATDYRDQPLQAQRLPYPDHSRYGAGEMKPAHDETSEYDAEYEAEYRTRNDYPVIGIALIGFIIAACLIGIASCNGKVATMESETAREMAAYRAEHNCKITGYQSVGYKSIPTYTCDAPYTYKALK